jgi:hypothetical protein
MKHRLLAFLLVFGWLTVAPDLFAQRAIILVRHAEKVAIFFFETNLLPV